MQDVEREIAARKQKVEALRRQREARNARESASVRRNVHFSISVHDGPIAIVDTPALISKTVQTSVHEPQGSLEPQGPHEHPETHETHGTQDLQDLQDPELEPSEFVVEEISELNAELLTFIDNASRCIQRSFSTPPGLREFTAPAQLGNDTETPSLAELDLKLVCEIPTSKSKFVAFSPYFDDLMGSISADGTSVSVWGLDSVDGPEFTLRGVQEMDVIAFSKQSKNHVYAGNNYGQVLKYDLKSDIFGGRFNLLPQLKTTRFEFGKVVGLEPVHPNFVISLHEDHRVCLWAGDVFAEPVHIIPLDTARAVDVVPTCMSLMHTEYAIGYGIGLCLVGTLNGQILQLPQSPNEEVRVCKQAHQSPVKCIKFRLKPVSNSNSNSNSNSSSPGGSAAVLASSGYDYSVNLWLVNTSTSAVKLNPILALPTDGTVTELCWHPTEPAVLAIALMNRVQVWNLNKSVAAPVLSIDVDSVSPSVAINASGQKLVVTDGDKCKLYILPMQLLNTDDSWVYKKH